MFFSALIFQFQGFQDSRFFGHSNTYLTLYKTNQGKCRIRLFFAIFDFVNFFSNFLFQNTIKIKQHKTSQAKCGNNLTF